MPDNLVLLRKFANVPEAQIAKAILEANDIPSILAADGASGIEPQLAFVQGVRLSVRESDVEAARELLEEPDDDPAAGT